MSANEQKASVQERHVLLVAMVDGVEAVRTRHAILAQSDKADARGELATGLAAIVVASSSSSGTPGPYQPNVSSPNAKSPSDTEVTNKKMYDNLEGFKHAVAATAEGPEKDANQNVVDELQRFIRLSFMAQEKDREKKRADHSKQNHYHCPVFKALEKYDNEKAGASTIAAFLSSLAYMLKANIRSNWAENISPLEWGAE
jgi:hypothetical protein